MRYFNNSFGMFSPIIVVRFDSAFNFFFKIIYSILAIVIVLNYLVIIIISNRCLIRIIDAHCQWIIRLFHFKPHSLLLFFASTNSSHNLLYGSESHIEYDHERYYRSEKVPERILMDTLTIQEERDQADCVKENSYCFVEDCNAMCW